MKMIKAKVIKSEEVKDLNIKEAYVYCMTEFINGVKSNKRWAILQGSKIECETLAENLNKGFSFLEKDS